MIRHGLAPASKLNENHHQHRRRRDGDCDLWVHPKKTHPIPSDLISVQLLTNHHHVISYAFDRHFSIARHVHYPIQLLHSSFIHKPVPSRPIPSHIPSHWHRVRPQGMCQPIITFNPSPLPRNYLITLFYIIRQFGCTDRSGEYSTPCNDNCPEAQGLLGAQQGNVF